MPVEIAAAGDRALAADVQRGERVDLPGIRLADRHAELLGDLRIGSGRFHAAEFERRPLVFVEIGQDRRCLHGLDGETQRRAAAHGAFRFRNRRAAFRHQQIGGAVKRAHARDVLPHHGDAGGLARFDRRVQFVDRCLFEAKRLSRRAEWLVHGGASRLMAGQRLEARPADSYEKSGKG